MKTNEAPEKIYINSSLEDRIWLIGKGDTSFIEYTRTDAFIEKAAEWLLTNASDYVVLHNGYDTKELVEDFVNTMKRD